jgi:peptide/nickel transport system permease protein
VSRYIIRRLAFFPPLLLVGALFVFAVVRIVPGDPAAAMLGEEATAEDVQRLREHLGWDDPLPVQFTRWLGQLVTGNLGRSVITNQPIAKQIADRLPVTLQILVLSLVMGTALGLSFGVASAVFRNRFIDHAVRLISVASLSVPAFFTLTLLILLPSMWWNYVPPLGYVSPFDDPWKNFLMFVPPTAILAFDASAPLMRFTRSACLDVLGEDYIRTARAKGLRERTVIWRHMFRNAAIPVVTILGGRVAGLLGGTVILEQVMSLSGLGQLTFQAVLARDYPVVQAMTVYFGAIVMMAHLLVDVSYAYFDPRIRYR